MAAAPTTWSSGIFDCFNDFNSCLCGLCCGCCVAAQNKAAVDDRPTTLCDYLFCPPEYFTRQQIRAKYGMEEAVCGDCMLMICCGPCALCQDARELKARRAAGGSQMQAPQVVTQYR
eukprot:TRINITY_DN40264_c0_g1_i1.p2 TRINITY_DN40264_c0_g1~~TRINITY_DN40264_c0_g1_i1.p2  ORF type:complete len:133 (-),score=27.34 TRINITY_DN40264_c0_g1_i1:98-448(-)